MESGTFLPILGMFLLRFSVLVVCSTSGSDGIIIADGNELFQRHFYFSASRLCLVAVYISIQSSLGPEQMIAAVRKEIKYVITAPTG